MAAPAAGPAGHPGYGRGRFFQQIEQEATGHPGQTGGDAWANIRANIGIGTPQVNPTPVTAVYTRDWDTSAEVTDSVGVANALLEMGQNGYSEIRMKLFGFPQFRLHTVTRRTAVRDAQGNPVYVIPTPGGPLGTFTNIDPATVSYTHLTLPTNREV